jgi:hypothetical protein
MYKVSVYVCVLSVYSCTTRSLLLPTLPNINTLSRRPFRATSSVIASVKRHVLLLFFLRRPRLCRAISRQRCLLRKLTRENYLAWQSQVLSEICGAQIMQCVDRAVAEPAKEIKATNKGRVEVRIHNPDHTWRNTQDRYVLGCSPTSSQ